MGHPGRQELSQVVGGTSDSSCYVKLLPSCGTQPLGLTLPALLAAAFQQRTGIPCVACHRVLPGCPQCSATALVLVLALLTP